MVKIECENCGKDVYLKTAFEITTGKVTISPSIGFNDAYGQPSSIKQDGLFCSLKCVGEWATKKAKRK